MSDSTEQKATRYLSEGRVAALSVDKDRGKFRVSGSEPYTVRFAGGWTCDCPARVEQCAHILACQKITKFDPARKFMFNDEVDQDLAALFD